MNRTRSKKWCNIKKITWLLEKAIKLTDDLSDRDASVVRQEIKDANKGLADCVKVMKERLKK